MVNLSKYIIPIVGLLIILFILITMHKPKTTNQIEYGVSFSPNMMEFLGLDWKKGYISLLDDLKIRAIRVPSFWEKVQPELDKYDFSQTDFMVNEAKKRDAKILFVIGIKQPRWPECHMPSWARELSVQQRQLKAIEYIKNTVIHYKNSSVIWGWQVENEPLFGFGDGCDKPDQNFLKKEVELVKELDKRPVVITDSGEWGKWITPMQLSDIFGISVYRKVHNPILGYITFPFPKLWYVLKSKFIRAVFASKNQQTIITELQTEPWVKETFLNTPLEEQVKLFSIDDFKNSVNYGQGLKFNSMYLWGVEWWYFIKEKGHPEYWEFAKQVFSE